MLFFSSGLVWLSLATNFYGDEGFKNGEIVVLTLYSPSILFPLGGISTSVCCKGKLKTWIETILIFSNLIVWTIIAVATLVGVNTRLTPLDELVMATKKDGYDSNISQPNIYFFSFGSFFISVYLTSSWSKQYFLRDENALTTTQWTFLATSGFLVMVTGFSLLDQSSCGSKAYYSCGRTSYGIFVGLLSGVTSCIMIPWRSAPLKCQAEFALILLVTWAVAIGYLTFNTGPAVQINTMYFGIYLSFSIAFNILMTTTYADSVLEASPYSQVEFGTRESERTQDVFGAAGFLDFAYANITRPQAVDSADDPRNANPTEAELFDPVGGSFSSFGSTDDDLFAVSSRIELETKFNKKVIVGKRKLGRIEIWFILWVESIVCIAVFRGDMEKDVPLLEQWIALAPAISIVLCFIGWVISTIQKKWAFVVEGLLILICIGIWIRGQIAVTLHFKDDISDRGGMEDMTANQLFMSYGSFFTSLYLFTNWSNASMTTTDWIFLSAASATMFGVLQIVHENSLKDCMKDVAACGQLELVILLAFGSAIIALIMVFVSFLPSCGRFMPFVHVTAGTLFLALWCFGSYFILFKKDGVGTEIGPTFFACWGVLFFCVDIATTNLLLLCKRRTNEDEDEGGDVSSVSSLNGDQLIKEEENQSPSIHDDGNTNGSMQISDLV